MNALQRGMSGMRALPSLWRRWRLLGTAEASTQSECCASKDNTGQLQPQILPWCHWRGCTLTAALRMRSTVRTRGLQRRAEHSRAGTGEWRACIDDANHCAAQARHAVRTTGQAIMGRGGVGLQVRTPLRSPLCCPAACPEPSAYPDQKTMDTKTGKNSNKKTF